MVQRVCLRLHWRWAVLVMLSLASIGGRQNATHVASHASQAWLGAHLIQRMVSSPAAPVEASCPPDPCTPGNAVGRDFFIEVVTSLSDVPMSDFAVDALVVWEPWENTLACWNPLATTWTMSIVCNFNAAGVQSYQNQEMGVQATANTLNLGYYAAIRSMLRLEAFEREALRAALDTWGTCSGSGCDPLLDTWEDLWNAQAGCCGCGMLAATQKEGLVSLASQFHSTSSAFYVATSVNTEHTKSVWDTKPVLGYFLLSPALAEQLRDEVRLTEPQFTAVRDIAIHESEQLRDLYLSSQTIVRDETLTLMEKRARIAEGGYNEQVLAIIQDSQEALQGAMEPDLYARFIKWIERQWQKEQQLHGRPQSPTAGRSYTVFATQYAANTLYEVALPDKCLKFANRGWSLDACPAGEYEYGQDYSVQIVREGHTVNNVHIWDVGPWNEDDNYWATTSDPQHRRLFTDLPLGMPEAQAAYYNDYNGGLDQFGRIVGNPAGIDLSDAVRQDLGLGYLENDWVTVTYLWTDGWDSGNCCGCGTLITGAQENSPFSSQDRGQDMLLGSAAPVTTLDVSLIETAPLESTATSEPANYSEVARESGVPPRYTIPLGSVEPQRTPPASANYRIPKSTFGSGGGAKTSTNYVLNSTQGQSTDLSRRTSTSYVLVPGYWSRWISSTAEYKIYLPLITRNHQNE